MTNKIICSFILVFLLLSCKDKGGKIEEYIPLTEFKEVSLDDSVLLKYPYRVKVCDSVAIILDLHASSGYYIHLFSYPEFEHRMSHIRRGKGPNEFTTLNTFVVFHDSLHLMDPFTRVQDSYSLKDLLWQEHPFPTMTSYDNTGILTILNYQKTSDGIVFVENGEKRKLVRLRQNGKREETPLQSPDIKIPSEYYPSLWNSFFAYDEKSNTTAIVTQLGDLLEIVNNDEVKSIEGKGGLPAMVSMGGKYFSVGKIDGYDDVKIYGDYIFALYSGADMEEIDELIDKDEFVPDGSDKLRVFNLNGDLVACFQLSHYATGFDLDMETKKMILLDVNSENQVVIYDASPIFRIIN